MIFYLGTHVESWLWNSNAWESVERSPLPLFISNRRLHARRKLFPPGVAKWALDSGGFSELSLYGEWRTSPKEYVEKVRRYRNEIGNLDWAAIQDWMCEPDILRKTGATVLVHQMRTVLNYLTLREMAPEIPWVPVLQGWEPYEYIEHVALYEKHGIPLNRLETVGVGTVCRRQGTKIGVEIMRTVTSLGLRVHAFGFKKQGLAEVGNLLHSADSMAWSFAGRRSPPLPECRNKSHKNCANCIAFACKWYDEVSEIIAR